MPVLDHPRLLNVSDNPEMIRYIDMVKLLSMLQKNCLFFVRGDKLFDDPFEGKFSDPVINDMTLFYDELRSSGFFNTSFTDDEIKESIANNYSANEKFRKLVTLNCWHTFKDETILMWKSYSNLNNGIAIRTNFSRVTEALNNSSQQVYATKIKYINFKSQSTGFGNTMLPFMFKRHYFSDEDEIRLIVNMFAGDIDYNWDNQPCQNGIYVDCDMAKLIKEIIVAPLADGWFFDLVKALVEKWELPCTIKYSALK